MMGITLIDGSSLSQIALTKSGALAIYARNQNTAWTRILTATQISGQYVPLSRTVNGKSLENDIVLTSTDTGSLAVANNLSDVADKATARTNLEVYSSTEIDTKVATINQSITTTNSNVTDIQNDITIINTNVNGLGTEIDTVRDDLDAYKTSTNTSITGINTEITTIQTDITSIGNDISTIQGDIQNVNASITSIQGDITDLSNDLAEYKTSTNTSITGINTEITSIKEDVTIIEGNISTIQGDIQNVNTSITSIQVDITDLSDELHSDYVLKTTTVNGQPLSGNVVIDTLSLTDGVLVLPGDIESPTFDGSLKEYIYNATPVIDTYTRAESDAKFVPKTTTVNGQPLSGNVTLTKDNVGLSNVTNDAQLKIASNLSDLNDVAAARTNLDVYSRAEVDAKSGGLPLAYRYWHSMRSKLNAGTTSLDGQLVSQTGSFADLYEHVLAGNEPVCTETEWQANPSMRGCYVLNSSTGMMRLPDLNGVHIGSYGPMYLTGDGSNITPGTLSQNAAPDIAGSFPGVISSNYEQRLRGALGGIRDSSLMGQASANNNNPNLEGYGYTFAASKHNPAYGRDGTTRVKPDSAHGVWVVVYATVANNSGEINALAIDTDLQATKIALSSRLNVVENRLGYSLISVPSGSSGTRTVYTNPFGINTPVIVVAEIYGSKWYETGWIYSSTSNQSFGTKASYVEGEGIVLQIGTNMATSSSLAGGGSGAAGNIVGPTAVRIHIWKITQ